MRVSSPDRGHGADSLVDSGKSNENPKLLQGDTLKKLSKSTLSPLTQFSSRFDPAEALSVNFPRLMDPPAQVYCEENSTVL